MISVYGDLIIAAGEPAGVIGGGAKAERLGPLTTGSLATSILYSSRGKTEVFDVSFVADLPQGLQRANLKAQPRGVYL